MDNIAIIGAGYSGLVTLKTILEKGYKAKLFEREPTCGGLWRYQPPSEERPGYVEIETEEHFVYPLYSSVSTNTAVYLNNFSDFLSDSPRGYLSHTEVLDYLCSYVDHFGLQAHIQYNSKVVRLDKYDLEWQVTYEHYGEVLSERFQKVFIASGIYRHPYTPNFAHADLFKGIFIHSSQVRDEKALFSGRRVLIIGGSYTGSELVYYALKANASHVFIIPSSDSSRNMLIWNRFLDGSTEWDYKRTYENCVESNSFGVVIKDIATRIDGQILDHIPVVKTDLPSIVESKEFIKDQIDTGKCTVLKSTIAKFCDNDIVLSDDTVIPKLDIVIAATGFKPQYPFLEHLLNGDKAMIFFKRMIPLDACLDGLAFVMATRSGIVPPLAEMHARWLCHEFLPKQYINKNGLLYTEQERQKMRTAVDKLIEAIGNASASSYNKDPRAFHTIHELASEINDLPPDHKTLLASSCLRDVELGVALYHGPFTNLRYRIARDRSTPKREDELINFAKEIMGGEFDLHVEKYMKLCKL